MNFVIREINFEFNFRFHVLGYTVILRKGNEIKQEVLATSPYEENVVNKKKNIQKVIIQFFENNHAVRSDQNFV